ncbi:MAG: serine/threonine-protein kinase, partial [Mycobacterium sp.]
MPLAADTAFAGYTVLRLLGSGGMGEVYLARHPRLPRQDALKVLRADISADSDYRQRFAREAELASKLWHQNIVSVHDCGDDDGRLWISMDYVDGIDAGRLLQDRYPTGMPLPAVLEIVTAVASALDYAHSRGLLHRDVKPSNILVADLGDGERRILLTDFGIARDLGDSSGLTVTNTAVGTVAYAAPEQLAGRPVDGRADQYELAATAYHLLTGAFLYPYSNPAVVIGQHLTAQPPSLADARPELAPLDAVLRKALAKNPKDRFGSCTEFARALAYATAMPQPTHPTYPLPAPAPSARRWPTVLAAAALAVAVCVVAYAVVKIVNRTTPPPPQFGLTGTVHVSGDVTTSGLPSEFRCAGAGELGDVAPGASVTVADDAGKVLAKGSFERSYLAGGSCNMSFTVDNVPSGANFYRVQVARQDETLFTESEAKAGVDITLGRSEPISSPTASASPSPTRTSTKTPTTPTADQAALARLRATAEHDRSLVPTDQWVAQLSSKRPGTQDDGIVYDYPAIWDHYLRFRQHYAQRSIDLALLWSGDWSTFDGRDYWVITTAGTFPSAEGALAWCRSEQYA